VEKNVPKVSIFGFTLDFLTLVFLAENRDVPFIVIVKLDSGCFRSKITAYD